MRLSGNEEKDGRVFNGYDYEAQAWVVDGVYQDCAHPTQMKAEGCCNAHTLAGQRAS